MLSLSLTPLVVRRGKIVASKEAQRALHSTSGMLCTERIQYLDRQQSVLLPPAAALIPLFLTRAGELSARGAHAALFPPRRRAPGLEPEYHELQHKGIS